MTKLQAWTTVTIILAIVSIVGISIYPPVGLGGLLVTLLTAFWTASIYEEETRLI